MATGKDLNPSYIKQGGRNSDGQRFRFQNFAQRLAGADIDVHHRLTADDMAEWRARELGEAAEGDERPFALQTLERWEELNQTRPFKLFRKEMQPLLLSVPLILRRQEAVFALLTAHLARASADALKPMLELAAALAVDLRQEYTPHFGPLLRSLAGLLCGPAAADVASLEDIFTTVAYLLKYLQRYLLAELPAAFTHYTPLLSHPKPHVRDFAAETFSFLIRRVPRASLPHELRAAILPHAGASPALDGGIALLLFHSVKGMPQRFNSRATEIVSPLLAAVRPSSGGGGGSGGGGSSAGGGAGGGAVGGVERAGGAAAGAGKASAMEVDDTAGMEAADGAAREAADGAAMDVHDTRPASAGRLREAAGPVSRSALLGVLSESLHLMNEHTRRAHCEPVWAALLAAVTATAAAAIAALGEKKTEKHGDDEAQLGVNISKAGPARRGKAPDSAHHAAAHAAAVFRLTREWVASRKGSRIPVGGLSHLLRALAPLLTIPVLTASARLRPSTREALIWEALYLVSSALAADTTRAETEADAAAAAGVLPPNCAGPAVLNIAQGFLPAVFSGLWDGVVPGAAGAIPGREGVILGTTVAISGASSAISSAPQRLALLPLDFGVSLIKWRRFCSAALPPLLRLCAQLCPTDPSPVLSTIYALSRASSPLPPLPLPPECVAIAANALHALAGPPDGYAGPGAEAQSATGCASAAAEGGGASGREGAMREGLRREGTVAADEAVARDAWAAAAVVRCASPSCILGISPSPPGIPLTSAGRNGGTATPLDPNVGCASHTFSNAGVSRTGGDSCRAALVRLLSSPPSGRLAARPPSHRAAVCAAAVEALTHLAAAETALRPSGAAHQRVALPRPATEGAAGASAAEASLTPSAAAGKATPGKKGKSRRASSSVAISSVAAAAATIGANIAASARADIETAAVTAGAATAEALTPSWPRVSPAELALECLARHLNEVQTSEGSVPSIGERSIHAVNGSLHSGDQGIHTREGPLHTGHSCAAGGCGPSAALLRACAAAIRGEPAQPQAPPNNHTRSPMPPPPSPLCRVWPPLLRCLAHGATAVRGAALDLLLALHEAGWLPSDEPVDATASDDTVGEPINGSAGGTNDETVDGINDDTGGGPSCASRHAAAGETIGVPMPSAMSISGRESTLRLLQLCVAVEECPHSPTSRQLVIDTDALARLAGSGQLPPSGIAIAAQYALGMLRIRFARVWPHVPSVLHALLRAGTDVAAGTEIAAGPRIASGSKMTGPRASPIWALILDALTRAHGAAGGNGEAGEVEEQDTERGEPRQDDTKGGSAPNPDTEGRPAAPIGRAAPPDTSLDASPDAERPDLSLAVRTAWSESISRPPAETDLAHLASQLLRALAAAGSPLHRLAVRDSASLMPLWRKLVQAHLRSAALTVSSNGEEETLLPGIASGDSVQAPPPAPPPSGPAPPKRLLSDWLRFFSSVDTPRSLSGAGALYADCSALVGHPLPTVQSLALDCLVRWGEPPLVKHRKHLAGLIDGKTFRENLTLFSVDSHHSSLTPEDRTLLLPLLSRILFSRLTRRVGRGSSKSGMASTRATIFAFFGGFAPQELRPLLDLMLAPIRMAVTPHAPQHSQPDVRQGGTGALPAGVTPNGKRRKKYKQAHGRGAPTPEPAPPTSASPLAISVWAGDAAGDRAASLRGVEGSTLLGVLRSLHEAVTQLGGSLLPYLPELLDTTNLVLRYAACCVAALDPAEAELLPTEAAISAEAWDAAAPRAARSQPIHEGGPASAPIPEGGPLTISEGGSVTTPEGARSVALPAYLARDVRGWAVKLLCKLVSLNPRGATATADHTHHLASTLPAAFRCLTPVLLRLHTHYTQSPSGVLTLLLLLAQEGRTLPLLDLSPAPALSCTFKCISAPAVSPSVIDATLSLAETLLAHVQAAADAAKRAAAAANFAAEAAGNENEDRMDTGGGHGEDTAGAPGWDASEADATAVRAAAVAESAEAAAEVARRMLAREVPLLLSQLHARLVSKFGNGADPTKVLMDAGSAESVTRELRMLTSLVGYVSSTQQAEQLTQLFLPYLRIKPTPRAEKVKAQVLGLLAGLLPMLEAPEVHARFLGLQFGNLRSRESRAALCRAWVALATEVDARARGTASTARGDGPMSHNGAGVVARSFHIGGDPCDQPALHGLGRVATLLEELNAYALDAIEERDYDRRIDGYNSVPEILAGGPLPLPPSGQSPDPASPSPPPVSSGLGCVAALPLLCQCVHDIETDDIALRHSASHTLTLIVRHAAQHISGHAASGASPAAVAPACSLVDPSEGATDASLHVLPSSGVGGKRKKKAAAATPAADIPAAPPAGISSAPPPPGISPAGPEWRSLLVDVLLPALRRGLRLPPERDMVRAEMIRLLAEALTAAPFLEPQLAALLNRQDPEADFFFNVVHVQLPRRQRALARLRQRVDKGDFSAGTLSNYLLPLLTHIALKPSAKELDVAEEALLTLRSVAEQLPWRPYHDLLQTLLRKLKREPLLERRLVRAMVSTIEGFHFDLTAADAEYASGAAEGRALALKAAGGGGGAAAGAGPSAVEDGPGAAAEAMEVEGQAAEGGADDTAGGVDNEDTAGGAHDEDTAGGADDGDTACGEDDTGGGDDDVLLGAEDAAAALAADADAAAAATALVDANVARARACAILATVRDRLLPPLYAHMRDPKTDGARVAVAVAVLKLLKLLPPRALAGQLKPFLMRLVATLGSRDKGVRARGREALGMVVVELGPGHFRAVVHELETSLKRGFQLQVLGYTLHYLLAKLAPTAPVGSLDYCAPTLVRLILADVFGEAADKKEVDAIANSMTEARSTLSYSSAELLASLVCFVPTVNLLIPPIHRAADEAGGQDSLKVANKTRELLRRCSQGLAMNPSVGLQPLCVYAGGLLEAHLPPRPILAGGSNGGGGGGAAGAGHGGAPAPAGDGGLAKRKRRAAPVDSVLRPSVEEGVTSGGGGGPLSQELLGFALSLLLHALRKSRIDPNDEAQLALMEPFLPQLQRAMRCDDDAVVSLALRSLSAMLRLPIPSLPTHATALLDRTFGLLKRSANFRPLSELVGVCVKVLTALLRKPPRDAAAGASAGPAAPTAAATTDLDGGDALEEGGGLLALAQGSDGLAPDRLAGGGARLSEPQLRWLLGFVSIHLDDSTMQPSLFGLLRTILARRFVVSELYDLMLVIGDMVLQADAEPTRSACSTLFLVFLLHYPLGPKRLQQQLDFLALNLAYERAQGRASLLALVRQVTSKLPLPLLIEQSDRLLLPLVTRLVNETDRRCVAGVGDAISTLLSRTCVPAGGAPAAVARQRVLGLLRAWLEDAGRVPTLGRAAAQLAGILVQALGEGAAAVAPELLPLLVQACVAEAEKKNTGGENAGGGRIGGRGGASGSGGGTGGGEEDNSDNEESGMSLNSTASELGWQTAYFSLKAIGKLCIGQPNLLRGPACAPLWASARPLLLHEHAWVRAAMGRAVGSLLAGLTPAQLATEVQAAAAGGGADIANQAGKANRSDRGGAAKPALVKRKPDGEASAARFPSSPEALLGLADALACQLRSPLLTAPAAAQAVSSLLWTGLACVAHPELAPPGLAGLLSGRAGRKGKGSSRDEVGEGEEEGEEGEGEEEGEDEEAGGGAVQPEWARPATAAEKGSLWTLHILSARLAPLTRRPGPVRGGAAVRWFGALASQMRRPQLDLILDQIVPPVLRAAEDASGKVDPAVKSAAAEALGLIQRAASPPAFVKVYQAVHDAQKSARSERKRRAAVAAVADPEATARQRISRNLGKKAAKARKLVETKRKRDGSGSIGLGTGKKRRQVEARR